MTSKRSQSRATYRSLCLQLLTELKLYVEPDHPLVLTVENRLTPPRPTNAFQQGEHNLNAVLTPELVQKMRQLRKNGWSYQKLSDEFDVDRTHARRICTNQAWTCVK